METPVLYFYAPRDVTVNVKVGFRQGAITEWYPHALTNLAWAGRAFDSTISWSDVNVSPSQAETFPVEPGASHYYKARHTDATPLQAGSQAEKFLFYRGVGQFAPPIAATVQADGRIVVSTPEKHADRRRDPVREPARRDGLRRAEYLDLAARRSIARRWTMRRVTPERDLVRILVAHGLYQKEAQAMVDTWSDSWFEEGARLLYIAPRAVVDAIVPLTITPAPSDVARVFVGRMELVTPVTRRDVRLALATDDRQMLQTYGRFLKPIADRVLTEVSPLDRQLLAARMKAVAASWEIPTSSCR